MNRARPVAALALLLALVTTVAPAGPAAAQTRPEGEMRFAFYVTISPAWFDPGEVTGFITPFWTLWAMHDALVKTMPGKAMAPSLAESWTVSPDGKTYDFTATCGRGVGPRVAEPALLLIDPYPWAAPYEELRLKPGR